MRLLLPALLGLALNVMGGGGALAAPIQDSPAPAPAATQHRTADPQRQAARLARKLQLTPQQQAAIEPILEERAQQVAQLRDDSSLDQHTRRSELRKIHQDSERQLRAILSDSQLQQYQQLQQQARQRHLDRKSAAGDGSE